MKMSVFWVVAPCRLVDVSEVLTASIIALMLPDSTTDTSVNFYQTTRRNSPEDSHLQDNVGLSHQAHFSSRLLIGADSDYMLW
jgi:hypothetical protein